MQVGNTILNSKIMALRLILSYILLKYEKENVKELKYLKIRRSTEKIIIVDGQHKIFTSISKITPTIIQRHPSIELKNLTFLVVPKSYLWLNWDCRH